MSLITRVFALASLALCLLPGAALAQSNDLGRIMFLGNSYIEGHDSPNLTWQGGSRKVIEDILVESGRTFDFVGRATYNSAGMADPDHNGYGGKGIDDLFNGIERDGINMGSLTDWVQESNADIYIIDIGRKKEEGSTREALKAQFMRVVDEIYSDNPEARIIWSEQTDPKAIWFPGEAEHLDMVNSVLSEIAADQVALGRTMQIAQVAAEWDPEVHLDVDGVHPSDAGYLFLGRKQADLLLNPQEGTNVVPEPILLSALPLAFFALKRRKARS